MQIRPAASTTLVAFVLAACGSSSDDFNGGSHAGASNATSGASGTGAAGVNTAGRDGATGSGGSSTTGGASGSGSNLAGTNNGAGGSNTGVGGSAGMTGMDSGAAGMTFGGSGGLGSGRGGRPSGGATGAVQCGGDAGCVSVAGTSARGGRGGRGMGGAGAGGASGAGTTAGMTGTAVGGACPASGHVSYTLTKSSNPTSDQQSAYDLITTAMDKAVTYYNCYTNITKADTVTYDSSVQTADGNINGSIRFGGRDYMEYITAMHEISHTVGVGTAPKWSSIVVNGIFTGEHATAELRMITGNPDDQLNADTQHFWPYGLNYTSEVKSEADVIDHCLMVGQIRLDLGFDP
jgi:hypothetical protein